MQSSETLADLIIMPGMFCFCFFPPNDGKCKLNHLNQVQVLIWNQICQKSWAKNRISCWNRELNFRIVQSVWFVPQQILANVCTYVPHYLVTLFLLSQVMLGMFLCKSLPYRLTGFVDQALKTQIQACIHISRKWTTRARCDWKTELICTHHSHIHNKTCTHCN